ncbi:MAG TPA: serine hydrolase domain-containing protein [Caulobacteraceae bacterium]|jgi:CubicO group peptidase (beta-lactamase class C family)|nr:serine hydrolase domain-containing protein [Caulobacteraceae bacterium]
MNITRRGWLGATAMGAAAFGAPLAVGAATLAGPSGQVEIPSARFQTLSPGKIDYRPALEALAAYARDELVAVGLPGMSLAVSDIDGFSAAIAIGWADLAAHEPMTSDRLFQIGSISKSFLALAILSLADAGAIDLDAPISRYLPDIPWPAAPITVAQVLSHTSGLPDGSGLFPRVPEGRLWTGFPAATKFYYSNTGFDLLGAMVEHVAGKRYQDVILDRVRAPLGLAAIDQSINQTNRARFPKAYIPWDQTVAAETPRAPLQQAKWDPEDSPAGSIAATASSMALYARALCAFGAGRGGPILSDAAARRFSTGVIASDEDFGPGSKYAMGIAIQPVDGLACLHHTGGMVAFSSSIHADPQAGVGAFASVNGRTGGYRPRRTTAYAISLMRAARLGQPLPTPPDPLASWKPKDPTPFLGRWVGPDGRAFAIEPGAAFPSVRTETGAAPVYASGGTLATPHTDFSRHGFDPLREGGAVTGLWWGETLFGRNAPLAQQPVPERLRTLAGVYINRDPWDGYVVVLARGETLVGEGFGKIVDRGGYWSLDRDPGGIERFRFDALLNGKARRLNVSGTDFERVGV